MIFRLSMSRIFKYYDFDFDYDDQIGNSGNNNPKYITEEEILKEYWYIWRNNMLRVGYTWLITEEHCINDWCIANYAEEVQKVGEL